MAKQRYRVRGVKREHSIISGLTPVLERIAGHPDVAAVVPGRIKVTQGVVSGVKIRYQTPTPSGLKLSGRSGRAVQEVFVITAHPETVRQFVAETIPEFED